MDGFGVLLIRLNEWSGRGESWLQPILTNYTFDF